MAPEFLDSRDSETYIVGEGFAALKQEPITKSDMHCRRYTWKCVRRVVFVFHEEVCASHVDKIVIELVYVYDKILSQKSYISFRTAVTDNKLAITDGIISHSVSANVSAKVRARQRY